MKSYTIEQVQNKLIGKIGTPDRNKFEYELQMDLIDRAINETRLERHLTPEELGKLIGVIETSVVSLLSLTPQPPSSSLPFHKTQGNTSSPLSLDLKYIRPHSEVKV
ncbi:MAG: transcriptional regulator, family [Daejeonella sp.]|nr:transcriptional regulator, family [Daejeonella sp.]